MAMAAGLFHWEVGILEMVQHPNVVALLAIDHSELSFTMELCDETLETGAGEILMLVYSLFALSGKN